MIADETTDTSYHEQLCLCMHFVKKEKGVHMIREEFLQFERATDLTGGGLPRQILNAFHHYGLDPAYMVGQGYDGASALPGHFNGL